MEYFTSSAEEQRKIAQTLVSCGCCPRCVLRHLGLKDTYTFRKDLSEISQLVDKLIGIDGDKKKRTTDSENNVYDDSEIHTQENSHHGDDDDMDTAPVVKPEQNVKESVDKNNEKTTGNDGAAGDPDHVIDSSTMLETDNTKEKKPCVACLGILEEFTSVDFLEKIRQKLIEEGYQFSTYLCSLMIPTCIILREHALFLHLQEQHREVYGELKDSSVVPIKEVWKWRNGPELRRILAAPFHLQSPMDITLNFIYPDSDKECNFLYSLKSSDFRKRKHDRKKNKKMELYNRTNVSKALSEMTDEEFRGYYQCPPVLPAVSCHCDISLVHEAVYVAGRYNKYSRTLSQTPWILDGVRKSELSVEELICDPIDSVFKPTTHKFSSSGREDVDVKMLGRGRPFLVELVNPRYADQSQGQVTSIQKKINASTGDVQVRDLQIVSREETENLKEGEIDKLKTYSALCWSAKPLSQEQLDTLTEHKDLTIYQKTPIRVLHRRPLSTREKCIHSMTVKKIDEYHFKLYLSTQAGTYIKEFVHGDFGRTKPNLCTLLGVDCDILELDVESVDLDWPKSLEQEGESAPT